VLLETANSIEELRRKSQISETDGLAATRDIRAGEELLANYP
jgi:hypothetical protein